MADETLQREADELKVIITGGSRGIGRAVAEAFLDQGCDVVVGGRTHPQDDPALTWMEGRDRLHFVQCDVLVQADVEAFVDEAAMLMGGVDVAVLNAGGTKHPRPIVDMTDEEWDYEVTINLHHVFWALRRTLRHMVPQRFGRVILTSSLEGKRGRPGVAGYAATKHALIGLTKAVAHEVGRHGITVNAICPGLVTTDMVVRRAQDNPDVASLDDLVESYERLTATGRLATAAEVASLVTYLVSPGASSITGTAISVDGGTATY